MLDPGSKIENSLKYSKYKFCQPIVVKKSQKKANKMISYLNFQANRSKSSAIIKNLNNSETSQNMSSHFNIINWTIVSPCIFTSFSNSLFLAVFENN